MPPHLKSTITYPRDDHRPPFPRQVQQPAAPARQRTRGRRPICYVL